MDPISKKIGRLSECENVIWPAEAFQELLLTYPSYDIGVWPNKMYFVNGCTNEIWWPQVAIYLIETWRPDGIKPLPEPMLTDCQLSPVTSILKQFHKRCRNQQSLKLAWKLPT